MIKALGETKDGKPLLLLGLTKKNCELLLDGKPIKIDLSELGGDGFVIIYGGQNEKSLASALNIEAGAVLGSACPECGSGRRDDGTCDCPQHQL